MSNNSFLRILDLLASESMDFQFLLKSASQEHVILELLGLFSGRKFAVLEPERGIAGSVKGIFGQKQEVFCFLPKSYQLANGYNFAGILKKRPLLVIVQGELPYKNDFLIGLERVVFPERLDEDLLFSLSERLLGPSKKLDIFVDHIYEFFPKGVLISEFVQLAKQSLLVRAQHLRDLFVDICTFSEEASSVFLLWQKLFRSSPADFFNYWDLIKSTFSVQYWTSFWIGLLSKSIAAKELLASGEKISFHVEKGLSGVTDLSAWRQLSKDRILRALTKSYVIDWKSKNGMITLPEFEDVFLELML